MADQLGETRTCALVLVQNTPWPPNAGARLRNWQNIVALRRFAELSVLAVEGRSNGPPPTSPEFRSWNSLDDIIADTFPPPRCSRAPLHFKWTKNHNGHPSDRLWNPLRNEALSQYLIEHRFDFCVIEDIILWRYIDALNAIPRVIIDCHNVQSQLDYDRAHSIPWRATIRKVEAFLAARHMRTIEKMNAKHRFIVCSEEDRIRLTDIIGCRNGSVFVVNNTLDNLDYGEIEATPRSDNNLSCNPTLIYSGVFNYPPNSIAARILIKKIYPAIKKRTENLKVLFVGKSPTDFMLRAAHRNPDIMVTGEVNYTRRYFQLSTAMCVPLTQGGGTRFKILEAFKYGVPVITSPKGCEGLEVQDGIHLLLARSPQDFAIKTSQVITDISLRENLIKNAKSLFEEKYTDVTSSDQMKQAVQRFFPDLFRVGDALART